MNKTATSEMVRPSGDESDATQEERVWTPEEAEEAVKQGSPKRRFQVGTAGKVPVYVTIKKVGAAVYADVINVEPRGVAAVHRRRERVLFFNDEIRNAVHCIRDLCKENEVEILTRYTDVVSVGDRDHHHLQKEAKQKLIEEADSRVLATYRTAAMTVEKIAEMIDEGMGPVLKECAKDIRKAIDADRRFRG